MFQETVHTCEEDEEQPEAVKENVLNQEDCTKESLGVALETFINDGNINVEEVDSNESSRDVENIMNVVNIKIVS